MKKILFILSLFVSLASFGQDTLIGKGGKKLFDTASLFNPYKTKIQTNIDSIASHNTRIGAVTVSDALKAPIAYPTFTGQMTANNTGTYYTPDYFQTNTTPGTTDMTSGMQQCLDSGVLYKKACLLKGSTYKVSGVTMQSGTTLIGLGDSISRIYTNSNAAALLVRGSDVQISNIGFFADSTGGSSSVQRAISFDSTGYILKNNVSINRNRFHGFNTAIYGTYNGYNGGAVNINNNSFDSNSTAVYCDTRFEYVQITNNMWLKNGITIRCKAGNVNVNNGHIQNSAVALLWETGTNDGHSTISNIEIKGSTVKAIRMLSLVNGMTLSNVMIDGTPAAGIDLRSCEKIEFQGGTWSRMDTVSFTSCTNTIFNGVTFTNKPIFTTTSSTGTRIGTTCIFIAGLPDGIAQTDSTFSNSVNLTKILRVNSNANTSVSPKIQSLVSSGATSGSGGAVVSGQRGLELQSSFYDGSTARLKSRYYMAVDAAVSSDVVPTAHYWEVQNSTGATAVKMTLGSNGMLRIGDATAPTTSWLTLAAGTTTVAPLKFISGTNLTSAAAGNMEYDGTELYFSPSTTRKKVDLALTGSGTLDFGSIASLGNAVLTITVTGAASGDVVSLGVPNGSMTAGLVWTYWVSATNTVSVQCYNSTLGAIDPASGTFKARVIQ